MKICISKHSRFSAKQRPSAVTLRLAAARPVAAARPLAAALPFAAALLFLAAWPAMAADAPSQEVSLSYSYVHTNAPPDHCDCFSMNGASIGYLFNFSDALGVAVDIGRENASNVRSTGLDLTLSSFLTGLRYTDRHLAGDRLSVFGQVLLGVTHASGGLADIATSAGRASNDFSALVGAGADINVTDRFAIRALEVDYYLTTVPNGVNGYQNNVRASVGVVLRF
jgi:peptidoglycan-associated lipoprotein